jgi:hypothetical protein
VLFFEEEVIRWNQSDLKPLALMALHHLMKRIHHEEELQPHVVSDAKSSPEFVVPRCEVQTKNETQTNLY